MNQSQQQFEQFALSAAGGLGKGHLVRGEDGEYLNFATQCYWDFWRASREALLKQQDQKQEEFIAHLADYEHEDTFHG